MKKNKRLSCIVIITMMLGVMIPLIIFADINVFLIDLKSLIPRVVDNAYYYNLQMPHLTNSEYQELGKMPEINIAGGYEYISCKISAGGVSSNTLVYGISGQLFDFMNIKTTKGRLFTSEEMTMGGKICLVEESFFSRQGIAGDIGQFITVDGEDLEIVGVIKTMDFKGNILIPSSLFDQKNSPVQNQHILFVQYKASGNQDFLLKQLNTDFQQLESVHTIDEYYKMKRQVCYANSMALLCIALPLVVFAVINCLLVIYGKLRNRKRSMGIMMVLGARKSDVFISCFVENLILGLAAYLADLVLLPLIIQGIPNEILLEFDGAVYMAALILLVLMCLVMSTFAAKKVQGFAVSAILRGE